MLYKIHCAAHLNWKKGKAAIIHSLHRQYIGLYQLNTVLCFTTGRRSWLGFRFLTFPLSFIFLTGSSFSNESGLVLKTWRETGEKERQFNCFCTSSTHYHLRRILYSIHNSYNSHIFQNVGSYSILNHLWRKAKWTNRKIPHHAKANLLFWRQTSNACLKL